MNSLRYAIALGALMLCGTVTAQLIITPNIGNAGVISTVSGSGIVVSNVTINCNQNAYGSFSNGGGAGFGVGTGLLLSTGNTAQINAPGINLNDDFSFNNGIGPIADPQLQGVIGAGVNIFDPCIIEFDVIPQCGSISLTFLFGSDEYTNWISQGFNDGFGFFVSGPNPAGGNYVNQNIATLPNGTVVSIDNVNPTSNPAFFVNNNAGGNANHLDGFTTVLTPTINVIPCQTYHFKLAIADAGDGIVDSAVLIDIIQCSAPLTLTTSSTPDNCGQGIGTASVTASGGMGPFSYSWAPNGGSATTATNLTPGTYTVTVQDGYNCTPNQSATVIVGDSGSGAVISTPSNQSVCNGSTIGQTVFSSSAPVAGYTWTNSNPAIGLAASGSGNLPSFTAVNSGNTPITATITINATPAANNCPVNPVTFTITVNPTPVITPPTAVTICNGNQVNIPAIVTNPASGVNLNWINSNPFIGLTSSGSGSIPAFTALNSGSSAQTATVTINGSSVVGNCPAIPVSFTITVNPTPAITPLPALTECAGNQLNVPSFVVTPVDGVTTSWTNSNVAIGLAASGSGDIGMFSTTNAGTDPLTATITVNATSSVYNCPVTPVIFTITINPLPELEPITPYTQCAATQLQLPDFSTTPANGVTVSWQNSEVAIGLSASGTGNIPAFTLLNSNQNPLISTISAFPVLGTCIGDTIQFTITALPIPVMDNPDPVTVCTGETVGPITFSGTPQNTQFDWVNSNTSIGLTANGTGSIAAFTAVNQSAGIEIGELTITPVSDGCSGLPVTCLITVNPIPQLADLSDMTLCANELLAMSDFQVVPSNAVVNWFNTNTTIGLSGNGVGNVPDFTTFNATADTTEAMITATPVLGNCSGEPINAIITVLPIPTALPMEDLTLCPGVNSVVSAFESDPLNASFYWMNDNTAIGLAGNGVGNMPAFTASNSSATPISGVISYVPVLDGCAGLPESFTITVSPYPIANAGNDVALCQGANSGNLIGGSVIAGYTYTWSPATGLSSSDVANPTVLTANPATTTYTLLVTNSEGCQATDQMNVIIHALPDVSFNTNATQGCAPQSFVLTNTTPNSADCSWTIGNEVVNDCGPLNYVFYEPGTFNVTLTVVDNNGCSSTETQNNTLIVYPNAIADFTTDEVQTTIIDPNFTFINQSVNATSYNWSFGDGGTSTATHPSHTFNDQEPGTYTVMLEALNEYGCVDTAYLTVQVNDELIFYIPNAFTPDADEFNNTFFPVFTSGFDKYSYNLLIFDRWGEIIFESNNTEVGWDGTYHEQLCKEGVYTWKIKIKERWRDKHHEFHGHVVLLK